MALQLIRLYIAKGGPTASRGFTRSRNRFFGTARLRMTFYSRAEDCGATATPDSRRKFTQDGASVGDATEWRKPTPGVKITPWCRVTQNPLCGRLARPAGSDFYAHFVILRHEVPKNLYGDDAQILRSAQDDRREAQDDRGGLMSQKKGGYRRPRASVQKESSI